MTGRVPADAAMVLHIGAPKTGSSAIQRHCQRHANALRADGFLYPSHPCDGNGISGGHGGLFTGDPQTVRQGLADQLAAARGAGCRLLLSAEGAFASAADVVPALPTAAFHVVCLLRHPVDAIASHHNQGVKRHLGTQSLSQAAAAIVDGRVVNPSLSGSVLFDWLRHCGRERMTVLPYVEHGTAVDAIARFRAALGLPPAATEERVNRSYTPAATAFRRLVNALPAPVVAAFDGPLDVVLQAYSDACSVPRPTAAEALEDGQLAALEAFFRADVARLESAFDIRLERSRPATVAPPSDTLADVWEHVRAHGPLAEAIRAAVAANDDDEPARMRLAALRALL